ELVNLTQAYSGEPRPVEVITSPSGLATLVTYNGSATPPTSAGIYAVLATIDDPNYFGTASGTLTITEPPPEDPVPVDVTAAIQIDRSGFRLNRATRRFVQTITVTNTSAEPISGPVSIVLDALSPNASLHAPNGITVAIAPSGSPFVNIDVGPDLLLGAG